MADTNPARPAARPAAEVPPVTGNQNPHTSPEGTRRVTPRWARWAVLILAVLGFGGFAVAWLADLI